MIVPKGESGRAMMLRRDAMLAEIQACHDKIVANRAENKELKARAMRLYEELPHRDLDWGQALAEAGKMPPPTLIEPWDK